MCIGIHDPEVGRCSRTSVTLYQWTWCYILDDLNFHQHHFRSSDVFYTLINWLFRAVIPRHKLHKDMGLILKGYIPVEIHTWTKVALITDSSVECFYIHFGVLCHFSCAVKTYVTRSAMVVHSIGHLHIQALTSFSFVGICIKFVVPANSEHTRCIAA